MTIEPTDEVSPDAIQPDPDEQLGPDDIPVITNDKPLDELVSTMPEVVPDAVQAAQDKEKAVEQVQSVAVDNKGRPFDPAIHAVDAAGNPIRTATGRFQKKKLRMPGDRADRAGAAAPGLNIPVSDVVPQDMRIKAAAAKYADLFIITGISFFGEEWKPEQSKGVDERAMLIEANERAMIQYGYVEPPAWIDLLMVYSLYMGKRCFQPVTKSKVKILWEKVKMFSQNIWLRVTGQKIKIVPTEK